MKRRPGGPYTETLMPPSEKQKINILKRDAKVLNTIAARKTGVGFSTLEVKTGLETNLLRGSINRLKKARKIAMAGASRSATYTAGAGRLPTVKVKKSARATAAKVAKRVDKAVKTAKRAKKAARKK